MFDRRREGALVAGQRPAEHVREQRVPPGAARVQHPAAGTPLQQQQQHR